ncbi:MAG: MBL fold metallo-hydrolase [Brevinematia bacterium]
MNVEVFVLGDLSTNSYVLWDEGIGIVFDPGDHPDLIMQFLEENNISLLYVLNTHAHFDHILGNNLLVSSTKARLGVNELDSEILTNAFYNLSAYMSKPFYSVKPSLLLKDGDKLEFLDKEIFCIHTPGHTPGSSCFYLPTENIIFTGDTLFKFSYGRTDLLGGNEVEMENSLRKLYYMLNDEDICFPGHGERFKFREVKLWLKEILRI